MESNIASSVYFLEVFYNDKINNLLILAIFSQRYGHKPIKDSIQIDSIDVDLRNTLWSILKTLYWDNVTRTSDIYINGFYLSDYQNRNIDSLCKSFWLKYFKKPLDTLSDDWEAVHKFLREYFFSCNWYEVYDFVEFVANHYPDEDTNATFMKYSNNAFQKEVSAYRFINKLITRITDKNEIESIEEASLNNIVSVKEHLNNAIKKLTDRKNPDYRNSIKESISAVESLVKDITESEKGTLGEAIKLIEKTQPLHPAFKDALNKLYGYTSDAKGIRHSLLEEDNVTFEEAKFFLVVCSAFINYVKGVIKE